MVTESTKMTLLNVGTKFGVKKLDSSGCHNNGEEIMIVCRTTQAQSIDVTDRQTDRQMDRFTMTKITVRYWFVNRAECNKQLNEFHEELAPKKP